MAPKLKMTKQMQYIILGVILGCGALFAIVNLVVAPLLAERKAALAATREIRATIEDKRGVILAGKNVQQQLDEVQGLINRLAVHVPLPTLGGNYLLGMEATIRACAKDQDVQIIQVANQDILEVEGTGFRVYRVRATAQAGYQALLGLLRNLQNRNPLLAISGLTIVPRPDNREKHEISFTVAWLIWADPAKRPAFVLKAQAKPDGDKK